MNGERECVLCDKVWGVIGVVFALACLAISVDLLSGGRISAMVPTRGELTDAVVDDGE
jgi:hypothetical protein